MTNKANNVGFQITNDLRAPKVRLVEEEILKTKYPFDYNELTMKLIARYADFVRNAKYHKLRKRFMKNENLCKTRYLDPKNLKGSKKDFYSPKIIQGFDKHYQKRK